MAACPKERIQVERTFPSKLLNINPFGKLIQQSISTISLNGLKKAE